MILGIFAFVLVFILIAPATRTFLVSCLTGVCAWLVSWAPFSFILLLILLAAPIVAIHLIKTWPEHQEPENPMAKYRNDVIED